MSCCTRTGSLNLHMKRTSIVIIIISKGCILGSSHKLMKIWSKGWRLVIIGFLFIYALQQEGASLHHHHMTKKWVIFGFAKGISSGFDSQPCEKTLKPTSGHGGIN